MQINNENYTTRNRQLRRIVSQYNAVANEIMPEDKECSIVAGHDSNRYSTAKSSMRSIPIQVGESAPMDEDLQEEEFNLRRVYESATWRMYNRIAASRRVSNNSINRNSSIRIQENDDNDQIIQDPRPIITRTGTPELFSPEDDEDCFKLSHHVIHDDMLIDDNDVGVFDLELES